MMSERDIARFVSKVMPEPNSGCSLWLDACHPYGTFSINGRQRPAHVVAYELVHGPLVKGAHVHHRCDIKSCVNVEHLDALSPSAHASLSAGKPRKAVKRSKKPAEINRVIAAFGSLEDAGKFLGITGMAISKWKRIPHGHIWPLVHKMKIDPFLLRPDLFPEGEYAPSKLAA